MNFDPLWPNPVRRKVKGFNLPVNVELAFVESVRFRVAEKAKLSRSEGFVTFQQSVDCYDFSGWATYSWDDGQVFISDVGVQMFGIES